MTDQMQHAGMLVTMPGKEPTSKTVPQLEYKILPLEKIQVKGTGSDKQPLRASVKMGGKTYQTTQRFWTSFLAKFGFSDSMFRYFDHQEVFDRICRVKPDTELRFCVEPGASLALAVSNPMKPVVAPDSFMAIAHKYKGQDVQYARGVVMSTYTPPSGERLFSIGPDKFANRFVVETPLDGYGKPSIYLSLLREICSNGAVAYSPSFRSDITLGKDPDYSIARALESFDSDEGYSAVRQRFEASQLSPASLWECQRLFRIITKLSGGTKLVKAYEKVVGDIYDMYGVANLDGLSEKKLKLLPAKCRVYDLINLATEVSTHHTKGDETRVLQAWLGSVISDEYDLEGTSSKKGDHEGVFIKNPRDAKRGQPRRRATN